MREQEVEHCQGFGEFHCWLKHKPYFYSLYTNPIFIAYIHIYIYTLENLKKLEFAN